MDDEESRGKGKFVDADERIYALLAVVEDQQNAVRAGIQGMAQERAAMATERVALVQQAEQMKRLSDKLTSAMGQAIPQMAEVAGEASQKAFRSMLSVMGQVLAANVAQSAQPELDKFKTAVAEAGAVQLQLGKAVKDFRRDWLLVVAGLLASAVVAASLIAFGAMYWQRQELAKFTAERDKLTAEIKALQEQEQAEQAKRNNGRKPTGK